MHKLAKDMKILEENLQDGKKGPWWNLRLRVGIYLGSQESMPLMEPIY